MNAFLVYLLESDVHSRLEVELWVAGGLFLVIGWLLRDAVSRVRTDVGKAQTDLEATDKTVGKHTRRLDRHEADIVKGIRKGQEYPPLDE